MTYLRQVVNHKPDAMQAVHHPITGYRRLFLNYKTMRGGIRLLNFYYFYFTKSATIDIAAMGIALGL
jgi:hypothetical protein